jgi:hypothetical protein
LPVLAPSHHVIYTHTRWQVSTAGQHREALRDGFDAAVATLTAEAATRRVGSFDREALRHLALLPSVLEASSWGGLTVTLPPGLQVPILSLSPSLC